MRGVGVKTGGGRPGNNKYFSHRHIFQINIYIYIYIYETIYASIHYCLSPFQSCITLDCKYMEIYWKYLSEYVEGGCAPLILLSPTGRYCVSLNTIHKVLILKLLDKTESFLNMEIICLLLVEKL